MSWRDVPLERAGTCERARESTIDTVEKVALQHIGELWTGLANESALLSDSELREEIEAIEKIQAAVLRIRKMSA
jgi:hypothetical protein